MKKIYFLDDDEDVLVYVEFLQSHGYQVKIHKFAEDLIFKLHKEDIPDLLITEMIIQNSAPSNRFGGKRYQFHANCASLLADELMDLQIRKIILTGWFEEKDPMYQEAKPITVLIINSKVYPSIVLPTMLKNYLSQFCLSLWV
jgi:hypothetical protein